LYGLRITPYRVFYKWLRMTRNISEKILPTSSIFSFLFRRDNFSRLVHCQRLASLEFMTDGLQLAREYHRNLPPHVREYLQQARGISAEVIDLHLLGWNGSRITIPI